MMIKNQMLLAAITYRVGDDPKAREEKKDVDRSISDNIIFPLNH